MTSSSTSVQRQSSVLKIGHTSSKVTKTNASRVTVNPRIGNMTIAVVQHNAKFWPCAEKFVDVRLLKDVSLDNELSFSGKGNGFSKL